MSAGSPSGRTASKYTRAGSPATRSPPSGNSPTCTAAPVNGMASRIDSRLPPSSAITLSTASVPLYPAGTSKLTVARPSASVLTSDRTLCCPANRASATSLTPASASPDFRRNSTAARTVSPGA